MASVSPASADDTSSIQAKKTVNKKIKVLVVEDEPILSQSLAIELESYNYDVTTADNGEDGLNFFYKIKPDVVLLDLLMPKKNGFEVLEELKTKNLLDSAHIIVLTNLGQEEDKKKAMALGAKHFFVKSAIDLEDLVNFIAKILA